MMMMMMMMISYVPCLVKKAAHRLDRYSRIPSLSGVA
jgi:hypothetical protein